MKKLIPILFTLSALLVACGTESEANNNNSTPEAPSDNTPGSTGDGHTYVAQTKNGIVTMQYNENAELKDDMVGEWKATFAIDSQAQYKFYCDGETITNIGPDRDKNGNYIPWVTNYSEGGLAKTGVICDVYLKKYENGGFSVFADPVVDNWVVCTGGNTFELKPNTEADLQNGAFYELYAEVSAEADQGLVFYTDRASSTMFPATVSGKDQAANNVTTGLTVKTGGQFTVYLSLTAYDVYRVWASTPTA